MVALSAFRKTKARIRQISTEVLWKATEIGLMRGLGKLKSERYDILNRGLSLPLARQTVAIPPHTVGTLSSGIWWRRP
jgi:hypothetical protein